MTLVPNTPLTENTCQLPCNIQSSNWHVQVKELSPSSSNLSSLWFRIDNSGMSKKEVNVRAYLSSPTLSKQIPLFNTVIINEFPSNKDFIFQHYYEHQELSQLEIELSWKSYDKSLKNKFIVNFP